MSRLLLELFSEEIPARMQSRAAAQLQELVEAALKSEGLAWDKASPFATPRRLVLIAEGLPEKQADRTVERKGPRVGAPQQAMDGFLRSLGDVDYRLEQREEKKASVHYAIYEAKGRSTSAILSEALPTILGKFPWPKSMRWGDGEARWVRPLHSILCLLGDEIVPFEFAGIASGRLTYGHRFVAPEPIEIKTIEGYRGQVERAYVRLDGDDRRQLIEDRARGLANAQGLQLRADPGLLRELEGLAEWPTPLLGRIDEEFMTLPSEVLVTSMRSHQKYLALETSDGSLAPYFVAVANIEAADGGTAIVAGNERVLRARLWDAKFFWDQDLAVVLEDRLPSLETMVFHADLGTVRERIERLEILAQSLASSIEGADPALARRAARLAKCDLVSGMVGEFPELQGLMGSYYARAHGEPEPVAQAIADHYSPQGPNDRCPDAPESIAVALADKIDTLAGFYSAGIKPTGSSDPFALRRAALGVIRLILENNVRLDLWHMLDRAIEAYGEQSYDQREGIVSDLRIFLIERLKVQQRQHGVRHDIIEAVISDNKPDLVGLVARVRALQAMIETPEGTDLLAGCKRAQNIVKQSPEFADPATLHRAIDQKQLVEAEECALNEALEDAEPRLRSAIESERFEDAVQIAASLRQPIDRFFDHVMVNVEGEAVRLNRLRLLAKISQELQPLADFSIIEDR